MLLLFKSAPATVGVNFAALGGFSINNNIGVTFAATGALSGLNAIELQSAVRFDALCDFNTSGRLTVGRDVVFGATGNLNLVGGFGGTVTLGAIGGFSATVGSTLEGQVTFAATSGITGDLRSINAMSFTAIGNLALGIPDISGGTLNAGVVFASQATYLVSSTFVEQLALRAFGDLSIVPGTIYGTPVANIKLSFSAPDLRLTFRK